MGCWLSFPPSQVYIIYIIVVPTALVTFCDTKTKRRGYVSKLELVAAAQKDPEAETDDILENSSKHLKHQYKQISRCTNKYIL